MRLHHGPEIIGGLDIGTTTADRGKGPVRHPAHGQGRVQVTDGPRADRSVEEERKRSGDGGGRVDQRRSALGNQQEDQDSRNIPSSSETMGTKIRSRGELCLRVEGARQQLSWSRRTRRKRKSSLAAWRASATAWSFLAKSWRARAFVTERPRRRQGVHHVHRTPIWI